MAKKTEARGIIYLDCTDCGERNYTTSKNRKNDPQRLELRRYCPRCRSHKVHKEAK